MPRVAVPNPEQGSTRVQRALYHRCRRGEPEALATLLYRLVDRLYTAASFAAPDEVTAQAALILAWEDLLAMLTRPRVGGHLQQRAFRLLGQRLEAYGDRATVRRQLRNAQHETEDSLLALPEEQLRPLVDMVGRYSDQIALNYRLRHEFLRRAWYASAAAVLIALAGYGWLGYAARHSTSSIQFSCLQERVIKAELVESLRDQVLELPDPQGADRMQARVLQRTCLALEELANSEPSSATLGYLARRVREEALVADLAGLAEQVDGPDRTDLLHAQLALEEVEAL